MELFDLCKEKMEDWTLFVPTKENFIQEGTYGSIHKFRNYAIKVPNIANAHPSYVLHEIDLWKDLDHPNIIRYITHFIRPSAKHMIPFVVMEYASDKDLFEYLGNTNVFFKTFVQIFAAVAYLHDLDIVHLDLKLENILVMEDQVTVKLCDFGNATKITGQLESRNGGSPQYICPEWNNPQVITKAMDIWSLGIMIYVFLNQQYPVFPDPDMKAIPDSIVPLLHQMWDPIPSCRPTAKQCLQVFRQNL